MRPVIIDAMLLIGPEEDHPQHMHDQEQTVGREQEVDGASPPVA